MSQPDPTGFMLWPTDINFHNDHKIFASLCFMSSGSDEYNQKLSKSVVTREVVTSSAF